MTADETLQRAQAPVRTQLLTMDAVLRRVGSEIACVLGQEGEEILAASGKRLRATLVLLGSRDHEARDEASPAAAAAVELIHLATLIHDDSIDGSELRRGRPAVHVTWDHKVATMLGDMLYSRAMEILTEVGDLRLLSVVARATRIMSQGELEEFLLRGALPDEHTYLNLIWAKTAAFFGACCAVGAILGGLSPRDQETLTRFGEKLGMAFQIVDDILDYTASNHQLGKEVGVDLRDGIVTLPLIAALSRAGDERERALSLVQRARNGGDGVEEVAEFVIRHGGIDYARALARDLEREAREALASLSIPHLGESLDLVAQYAVQRER